MPLAYPLLYAHILMDTRLLKAAQLGDIASLLALLDEDPLILERISLAPTKETPLHVAALAGKPDFVHEIILRKPLFAWELNQDGLNPLHIASAVGNKEVVHELLELGSHLCMLRDKERLIPLHHAAMKGRVAVIEELLQCCPESLKERTTRTGQTVLHLAVKNYQFETLKILVEKLDHDDVDDFITAKDKDGNTILEMAKASKQQQVLEYLEERHSLSCDRSEEATDDNMSKFASEVVATLIAAVTYQAGLSPPEKFPKSDNDVGKNCTLTKVLLPFGVHSCPEPTRIFYCFIVLNTTGFFCAVVLLLLRRPLLLAKYLMQIALSALAINYIYMTILMTPRSIRRPVYVMTAILAVYIVLAVTWERKFASKLRKRLRNKYGNKKEDRMAKGQPSLMTESTLPS